MQGRDEAVGGSADETMDADSAGSDDWLSSRELMEVSALVIEELDRLSSPALRLMSAAFLPEFSDPDSRLAADRLASRLRHLPCEQVRRLTASRGACFMGELCSLLARCVRDVPWVGALADESSSELQGLAVELGLGRLTTRSKPTLISTLVRAARLNETVQAHLFKKFQLNARAAARARALVGLDACPDMVRFEVAELHSQRWSLHALDARCHLPGVADESEWAEQLRTAIVHRLEGLRGARQLSLERLTRVRSVLQLPEASCNHFEPDACLSMVAMLLLQRIPLPEVSALAVGGAEQLLSAVGGLEVYSSLMRRAESELASWAPKTLRVLSRRYFPEELMHTLTPDRLAKRLASPFRLLPLLCAQALLMLRTDELLVELAASIVTAQRWLVRLAQALRKKSPEELRAIAAWYNVRVTEPLVTRILTAAACDESVLQELLYWVLQGD